MLRVKFEGINSEEDVSSLLNKEIYLPLDLLPNLDGKKFYYHEIIGYEVIDSNYGPIGLIEKVNDKPTQSIFVIKYKERQILIPINEEIIKEIDRKNKSIYISAPNGLIDLYLE